ncbi:M48 family metalloprotease [Terrabacter sp. BE26]|uniref:M48 family metallopeptidase n=1 Tax=Terrabacter sp. BE26 TaxID=2898152 RepID=UPI0035BE1C11
MSGIAATTGPATTPGATVMAVAVLGVAAAAVVLLGWATFLPKNPVQWVGVVLGWMLVAAVMPRPVRTGDAVPLDPGAFPHTHELVSSLAAEIGVQPPAGLLVSTAFGARVMDAGWRRRPVLTVGLPLWTCLAEDERIALIGHELGHLRGGRVRTAVVAHAHGLIERTATLLTPLPRDAVSDFEDPRLNVVRSNAVMNGVGRGLLAATSLPAVLLLLTFERITSRERQMHAYAADLSAAQVAGTTAVARLLISVANLPGLHTVASAAVRRREDPFDALSRSRRDDAHTAGEVARARTRARTEGRRWDAAHPRDDLRLSVLEAHATQPGVDLLAAHRSLACRADTELANLRTTLHRALRDELLETWM